MSAYTRVRMTFEVVFRQPWNEDCQITQVRKQTTDQAETVAVQIADHVHRSGCAEISLVSIDPNYPLVLPKEG